MSNSRFASVPNISIPRSRWKQPFNHSTSFNHGQLIPIDCFDILPGDTYKLDLSSMIWMSNPIRPIFGNITAHISAYFVPMRLVWDYTKEFFGENKTSAGYQSTTYKIPSAYLGYYPVNGFNGNVVAGSVSHYLGKPITSGINLSNAIPVSVLKERAYYEIWNNYYRAQQIQNPVLVSYGGNGSTATIGTLNGSELSFSSLPLQVCKEFDYFTAATLAPQYGPAVTLPLGSFAPVIASGTSLNESNSPLLWAYQGTDSLAIGNNGSAYVGIHDAVDGTPGSTFKQDASIFSNGDSFNITPGNLFADLSNATAATINNLRYAFAVQKYLERSNFGSRFFEMLSVHYGVTSPDATLQIPQRLGHFDININVSTVLSTAGAAVDDSSELGMPGAVSCTASKHHLFTHAFTEPGYLMILLSTTHERSYSQGILREDMKLNRFDIYSPEFANLGDQEVLNAEIYYDDSSANRDVFGYQEHWAEYRYRPHRTSGLLDPRAPNALDFWVLTDEYASRPSLSPAWIVEDRASISRALVSGENGPDYIGDFYLPYVATREMPLFTIPGLIDHFGAR